MNIEQENLKDEKLERILEEKDKMKEIIHERLQILMKENNMTHKAFFEFIEYEQSQSNISKILKDKTKITRNIALINKVAKKCNVSVNWLIGNLPLEIRHDNYKEINDYIGLNEQSIEVLNNLKKGDRLEQLPKENSSEYPDYKPCIDIINEIINSNNFTSIIYDLRCVDLCNRNCGLQKSFEYNMGTDLTSVILSKDKAREFLIENACNHFRDLINEINNIK